VRPNCGLEAGGRAAAAGEVVDDQREELVVERAGVARHHDHALATAQHLRELAMVLLRHFMAVALARPHDRRRASLVDIWRIAVVKRLG
jgi:hypothetical protein